LRGSRLGPIALAVLVSGLATVVFLSAAARRTPASGFAGPVADGSWTARARAWFTPSGFHQAEFDTANPRNFSWTTAHSEITVPAIDRSRAYRIRFRIAAGRGPGVTPPPDLVVSVDGIPRLQTATTNDTKDYTVLAGSGPGHTLTVALDLSNTFVPGPNDRRALGVVVEGVAIEPVDGKFRPLAGILALAALATMAYAAAAACCGFSAAWTLVIGLVVAAMHAWLLDLDGAFLGLYVQRLVAIGAGAGVLGLIVGGLRWRWPASAMASEWPLAAGLLIVAAAMKLAFFGHAAATIGDAVFQVHRAMNVLGGHYFFTSITPRPFFEFPYAIALYVAAMPMWGWFSGEIAHVLLLRAWAIAADAAAGLAMYFALRRAWADARPALLFAALWPFALGPESVLCTANLTNLFGQGVFGVAMGVIGWMVAGGRASAAGWIGATVLVAIGFLSHFSTISVGVPLLGAVAMCLFALGKDSTRRLGVWILACTVVAGAVSYLLYYSHFHDVYAKTIERVAAREGEAATRSMVAPVSVKFGRWMAESRAFFGAPVLLAAVVGAAWLALRRRREGFTLVLAGWALTWLVFSALGIFTAIEMRSGLATSPLMLALACYTLGSVSRLSRTAAIGALAVALAIAWIGVRLWMDCLGG
jgi:hypothetical protein